MVMPEGEHSAVARLREDRDAWRERALRAEREFEQWRSPSDPEGILPQIIAARCLGIEYGDPGPKLREGTCNECWGERHVWLGNVWGLQHRGGTMTGCKHECHRGEVWMA